MTSRREFLLNGGLTTGSLNRKSGFVLMTNGENGYIMTSKTLKDLVTSFV